MKIVLALDHVGRGGPAAPVLAALLNSLVGQYSQYNFSLLCTLWTRGLVDESFGHLQSQTLPLGQFWARANAELGETDVLIAACPLEAEKIAHPQRCVFLLDDTDADVADREEMRLRRLGLHLALCHGGAVAVASDMQARRLQAHPWHRFASVISLEREGAARLLEGCEMAAATRQTPHIHVADAAPLVSIVTPSFNQGRFLKQTIDSVLGQSYPHVELLVMDGGSTDQSAAILQSYGDRFVWVSEKDKGQTHAINKGMARARGQVLAYLNSDDVILPDAVEKAVGHFQQRPECDMVYGRAWYTDENSKITGIFKTDDYRFERLMNDCCVCQPAAFWRRRIAELVGPFDESLDMAMDMDYWLRIDRAGGRIEHISDYLAYCRIYAQTKTLSARARIYQEIFDICHRHGGYVAYSYFVGLWEHRIKQQKTGWARYFNAVPGMMFPLAWLHWRWYHRQSIAGGLVDAAMGRIARGGGGGGASWPRRWAADRWDRLRHPRSVRGLWDDNWTGGRVELRLPPRLHNRVALLGGRACCPMRLTVHCDGKLIARHDLPGGNGEVDQVQLHLPIGDGGANGMRCDLRFSRLGRLGDGRKASFLIQRCDLFDEAMWLESRA